MWGILKSEGMGKNEITWFSDTYQFEEKGEKNISVNREQNRFVAFLTHYECHLPETQGKFAC